MQLKIRSYKYYIKVFEHKHRFWQGCLTQGKVNYFAMTPFDYFDLPGTKQTFYNFYEAGEGEVFQ